MLAKRFFRVAARIIAVTFACVCMSSVVASAQQAPAVDVARPLMRSIVEFDVYTGRFEAVDRVEIRSRVSGYLERVAFEDGEIVPQGALLFVIDQRTFRAEIARAEATVAAAEAQRALAQLELDRATTLAERNVGSVQDVDRAKATMSGANAQVAIAEAELRQARLNLDFTEIRAPITGQMSNRKVDPGNLVVGGSNTATLLSTIVSIDPVHFVFTASEADFLRYTRLSGSGDRLAGLSTPYRVDVRLMDEDTFPHQGTLDFVDNQIDPNSGTIVARALLPNPDRFFVPGTFGRIRLPGSGQFDALLIPDEAVIADQARKIVMIVDAEGTVSPRPVTLGALHKGLRVVKAGLSPDDRVVVAGIQRARPGAKVSAQEITLTIEGE
ncbi:MAG TPA: efflux RND transporter periplasmic adaptor subunit [Thermohalobaculum sp.]|nr:efflux RND transporter periplasmic adaptor subunit [Thermohalobaculum sp.]